MKKILVLSILLGASVYGTAQPSQLLRIKVRPGQSFKYVMDIDSGMKINMQMTMKVMKAQNNLFTMNTTMGSMMMNGQAAPPAAVEQFKKMLIITVMDARGNTIKTEVKGVPGMTTAPGQGSSVPFPLAAVRVGSAWKGTANIQGQKVETSYKLIAFKPVAGKQAAVIHATPKGMKGFNPKGPIVFSVELATGFPISMSMSGTSGQGGQPVKMTMRRV